MSEPVSKAQTIVETTTGGVLTGVGVSWWYQLWPQIDHLLASISLLCGAIIGIAGVITLIRRKRVNNQQVP